MTEPRDPDLSNDDEDLPFDKDMNPVDFTGPRDAATGPRDAATGPRDAESGPRDAESGPRDQVGFYELGPDKLHPIEAGTKVKRGNGDQSGGGDDGAAGGAAGGAGGNDQDSDESDDGGAGDEDRMGLLDHLDELRTVLIQCFFAALAATILCWFWSADLLDLLIKPIENEGIYFTAPNEAFLTRIKLSAVVGLFVVVPFIFFKFYGFVLPGLYQTERKVVTPLLLATTVLFYTGVSFAFMVVIPQVVTFLLSFGTENLSPLIGVGPYFSFVTRLCLAFGLVFELPLLVLFLSVIGLVNPKVLLRTWRYAVVAIAGLSAVLTPPDVISQVMMAGPVLLLYIISVLVSIVVTRKRRRGDSEESTKNAD